MFTDDTYIVLRAGCVYDDMEVQVDRDPTLGTLHEGGVLSAEVYTELLRRAAQSEQARREARERAQYEELKRKYGQ